MALSNEQKKSFLNKGFLKLKSGLSEELMHDWTSNALNRLNYDPSFHNQFPESIIWMDHHIQKRVAQIAPKAWEAICEVVGGEKMIEKRTMGIESKHFTQINSFLWSDAFIINFHMEENEAWLPPQAEGFNWHKDGSYFRHFCDSPEQALLLVILWKDVETQGGGTFLALDSPYVTAKTLLEHPEGLDPSNFNFGAMIKECSEFIEITGIPAAIAALTDFPKAAASGRVITIPFGFCETALSINLAISTMSKVAGAVYLQDIPISAHPLSTPFLATDQNGSLACPCDTTITSTAKADTESIIHATKAKIDLYIVLIIFPLVYKS